LKLGVASLATAILLTTANPAGAEECNMWLYEWYLYDSGYDVIDRDWFKNFLTLFRPVLEHLDHYGLTWDDINIAMNVYSSWQQHEESPNAFMSFYHEFLAWFSNPEIELAMRLEEIGIIPVGIRVSSNEQG